MLRATSEYEEIDGVHLEGVDEIVPSVSCIDESTSPLQTSCTGVIPGQVCGFNKSKTLY